ncbi:MAG: hypothetical protein JW712_08075 [Dehalococcoidales bacterium]|nr:hypothetical protein [Dehalococcoidales bacterium]
MDNKIWIYAGLIVIVVALVGVGAWLVSNPSDPVTIPDTDPVIVMDISNIAGGEQSQLSIYEDGTVIRWEDTGLNGAAVTRTWRTGKISVSDVEYLFDYMDAVGFDELEPYLLPETMTEQGGSYDITDEYLKLSADGDTFDNEVTVYGYFSSGGDPYGDLPHPVDGIYEELNSVVISDTEEVLTEELSGS